MIILQTLTLHITIFLLDNAISFYHMFTLYALLLSRKYQNEFSRESYQFLVLLYLFLNDMLSIGYKLKIKVKNKDYF